MKLLFFLSSLFLTAFGQPAWIRGCGVLAAALGFALFWKAMLSFPRPRDRFFLGMIWFAAVQGIQLSWLATLDYMGPLILFVYLFLILAMGAQFGVLSLFVKPPLSWHRALAIAGSWVLFEWARLFLLCGFTWNPVGLALTDSPESIQFASVFGIFGLSFWVILVNVGALKAWLENTNKQLAIWASLAFFPYLFGIAHEFWITSDRSPQPSLRVAVVQTDLSLEERDVYVRPIAQWEEIFTSLQKIEADLIVLPEGALPLGAHKGLYFFSEVGKYFDSAHFPPIQFPFAVYDQGVWKVSNVFLLQTLANQTGAHVIAGLDDRDYYGKYNAAFHFLPQNLHYERYEKQILVPIGEYIPLKSSKVFAQFVGDQFGIYGSFDAGTESKIFQAQVPIGISICVEETFSELIRRLRGKGAQLLVNVTNDIWFPRSKLARQHFDHGRIRAAENGVPLVRSCNAGISGAVDAFGKPVEITDQQGALSFSLPLHSHSTLYTWWGDSAILGISLGAVVSYFGFRKKKLP